MNNAKTTPVKISDVVLRDGHQSLIATRMRTEDMLPICAKLDAIGFHALEVWGGATFDACVRFLKEDPWERLTALREALPDTPLQMLLRGQNLLGTATMPMTWSSASLPAPPTTASTSSGYSMRSTTCAIWRPR